MEFTCFCSGTWESNSFMELLAVRNFRKFAGHLMKFIKSSVA